MTNLYDVLKDIDTNACLVIFGMSCYFQYVINKNNNDDNKTTTTKHQHQQQQHTTKTQNNNTQQQQQISLHGTVHVANIRISIVLRTCITYKAGHQSLLCQLEKPCILTRMYCNSVYINLTVPICK